MKIEKHHGLCYECGNLCDRNVITFGKDFAAMGKANVGLCASCFDELRNQIAAQNQGHLTAQALTYDNLADIYKEQTSRNARIVEMDKITEWAESRTDIFEIIDGKFYKKGVVVMSKLKAKSPDIVEPGPSDNDMPF